MPMSLPRSTAPRLSKGIDAAAQQRLGVTLALLRRCVEQCGWTYEALQAAMRKDKSHIHGVLHGTRPMSLAFIDALPDDIEAAWHTACAEAFGRVVIQPASGESALRQLAAGLLGVLAQDLPDRASAMAKAALAKPGGDQ